MPFLNPVSRAVLTIDALNGGRFVAQPLVRASAKVLVEYPLRAGIAAKNAVMNVYDKIENKVSNIKQSKPLKRIEDYDQREITEINTIRDQLSISDFAKMESRQRKLLNKSRGRF